MLLGSLAVGAVGCLGGTATRASAAPLGYDGPAAFDEAEQAYLANGFQDNEGGGYAWGASYYLLGLLRMFEAYGDTAHLDRFGRYADHVLATTDSARGVSDHAGRSGPVWRTAGAYTASHGTVRDASGTAVLQLRWASSKPAEAIAEISNVTADTFTLTLRSPTGTVTTLAGVTLDPSAPDYVVDRVNGAYTTSLRWTAKDLRRTPKPAAAPPAAQIAFASQFYVFAVHTGMVTYPLAMYARMVLADMKLARSSHGGRARRVLRAVERAIAFHDEELLMRGDGTADYVWPKGAPVPFDGLIQPSNQSHGLGLTMAELFRVTGQAKYADRVRALLATFLTGITQTAAGAYVWTYWPVHSELYRGYGAQEGASTYTPSYTASQQVEDISHAAISVEFVHAAHEAGIADLDEELSHFALTYTKNVIRSESEVFCRVDGTGDAVPTNAVQCARWIPVARYDKQIYTQSVRVYEAAALVPSQGSHALGVGYLNWARRRL